MKKCMCWCLSIIELKNALRNIENICFMFAHNIVGTDINRITLVGKLPVCTAHERISFDLFVKFCK